MDFSGRSYDSCSAQLYFCTTLADAFTQETCVCSSRVPVPVGCPVGPFLFALQNGSRHHVRAQMSTDRIHPVGSELSNQL